MKLLQCAKEDTFKYYKEYFNELEDGINFYVEKRILESTSYLIRFKEQIIGIVSIEKESWITGFYIFRQHRASYFEILDTIIEENHIQHIYMTDKDKVLVEYIKSNSYPSEIHAYNFSYSRENTIDFEMELLPNSDIPALVKTYGEFLEYNNVNLEETEFYVFRKNCKLICLGFYEQYQIINRASVAMIVHPDYRKQGYGAKILQFLAQQLQSKNIPINARCWVKNKASRMTLLRAGYVISSHTINVHI